MRSPVHGLLLLLLAALFLLRVLGQALQRWLPQPWLPPFATFQGSGLPYPVLLGAQAIILALMARATLRALLGSGEAAATRGRSLLAFGVLYLIAALARIAIGIGVPSAPAWFSAWIPGFFHVVIAAFVVVAGDHQRRLARPGLASRGAA